MTTKAKETAPAAQPPAKQSNPTTIKGWLSDDRIKEQIRTALPKHMTVDRFLRIAITATTRTPKLKECTPESMIKCLLDLSAAGLEPNGRDAHLIPYGKECTLIVDYKGLVSLVRRSGEVSTIYASKVCQNDDFSFNKGIVEKHTPKFGQDRGHVIGYYATATLKDGGEQSEFMTLDEIEAIRDRSKAKSSGPWKTDYDEMAKKTVFKRLTKWLPLAAEAKDAIIVDNKHELAGIKQADAHIVPEKDLDFGHAYEEPKAIETQPEPVSEPPLTQAEKERREEVKQ